MEGPFYALMGKGVPPHPARHKGGEGAPHFEKKKEGGWGAPPRLQICSGISSAYLAARFRVTHRILFPLTRPEKPDIPFFSNRSADFFYNPQARDPVFFFTVGEGLFSLSPDSPCEAHLLVLEHERDRPCLSKRGGELSCTGSCYRHFRQNSGKCRR